MALGDFFQDSPNYVNPDYATDAQRKQLRAYSEMLMKRSSGDITRPAGAFANIIDALTGRLEMNRAGNLEQQALAHSNDQNAALIAALQGNQQPQTTPPVGPMGSVGDSMVPTPTAPTNAPRAEVQSSPKVWGDKEAEAAGLYEPTTKVASLGPAGGGGAPVGSQEQPSVLPTAGAPASPNQRVAQAFDPKLLAGIMTNQMTPPESRALIGQLLGQKVGEDVYGNPSVTSIIGGARNLPQSNGYTPGYRAPEGAAGASTVSPIVAPNAGAPRSATVPAPSSFAERIAPVAKAGQQLSAEGERVAGGAKAESNVIENDVKNAAAAPDTLKSLSVMEQTIHDLGPNITFGPTAKVSADARRVIANYAPGLVNEKALAGADAIEKLNLGLAGTLSARLGLNPSDISRSIASVPGTEKSKEGTLALIGMLKQQARNDQYVGTTLYQQYRGDLAGYQEARAKYFAEHPIINPITGKPVGIATPSETETGKPASGFKVLKVY